MWARDVCTCKELEPETTSPIMCEMGNCYGSSRNQPQSQGKIVRETHRMLVRLPGVQLVYPVSVIT